MPDRGGSARVAEQSRAGLPVCVLPVLVCVCVCVFLACVSVQVCVCPACNSVFVCVCLYPAKFQMESQSTYDFLKMSRDS